MIRSRLVRTKGLLSRALGPASFEAQTFLVLYVGYSSYGSETMVPFVVSQATLGQQQT